MAAVSVNYFTRLAYPLTFKEELRFVPQKEVVEILSLDHRGLAADVLFIQTILHSGSLMWKPLEFDFDSEWSYQTMDLATTIDPRYYTAYLFSGMGLVHGPEDVRLARPILERGIIRFPNNWELPFWIGHLHNVYLEDHKTAAEYFWRAFQCPDAPKSFLSLLLSSLKKGGQYERAIVALKSLIDHTDNPKIVQIYEKRLVRLEIMVMLQKAATQFRTIKGYPITELNQLITEKIIPEIPVDPMGKKFVWDTERFRVKLDD